MELETAGGGLTCDGELLAGSLAGLSSRGAELFCFLKLGKRD